jgi:drug/metabolite transporter (DMT)-like permease
MSEATARAPAPLAGTGPLFLSALCYGLNAAPAREAAGLGLPGPDIVALRNVLLFAGLVLAARLMGWRLAAPRRDWPALIGLGLASACVGVGYISAVGYIPVGVAVMVFYAYPLLILILSPLVDGTRPTPLGLVAFALAFAGLVLAIGPSFDALDPRGLALAALACLGAVAQLFLAARAPGGGGVATVAWAQATMIPIAVAFALAMGGPAPLEAWRAAAWPAFITIALYMAAYVLQMRGMRRTPAAAAGLIYCLEPIVAIAAAALWLGERLTAAQYAGATLVVAALALDVARRAREKSA